MVTAIYTMVMRKLLYLKVGPSYGGMSYYYYEITTQDDNLVEDDGTITVEVLPSSGYDIDPEAGSVAFTVFDDDEDNFITVEAIEGYYN